MTRIIFSDHQGNETEVNAADGESVMEAALNNNVEGILAECGGACACATCHVYVDDAFMAKVGEPSEMEQAMLEFNEHAKPNSRLSCQLEISPELDGLKLSIPETQY